jgi:16S rRNA (guanine(966)-N(2))-methyltransferase RsmD
MKELRTQLRIVAGSLKGRKLECVVHEALRPTPQMVREALFSILGNAVPNRPFYDIFAGTGVNGIEAVSRGASHAIFIERDAKLSNDIDSHLKKFGIADKASIYRSDVYRWAERWIAPIDQPVNLFLSPPFADLTARDDEFLKTVRLLMEKAPNESVVTIQAESGFPEHELPDPENWDIRKYGRNVLMFWVKDVVPAEADEDEGE